MRPLSFRRVGLQAVQLIDGPVDKILTTRIEGRRILPGSSNLSQSAQLTAALKNWPALPRDRRIQA
jgi:hypothetical protein